MEDALADAGYEPLQACNGLEALEVLEAKHVDLIVLDIMMPKMDGYELLKQIRQAGMDMPVLLVTAKQALPDKKKGFLLGADDYKEPVPGISPEAPFRSSSVPHLLPADTADLLLLEMFI